MALPQPPYPPPGVTITTSHPVTAPEFVTGVPAFLGYVAGGRVNEAVTITRWSHFQTEFAAPDGQGFLAAAVEGFFGNGGTRCRVVGMAPAPAATAEGALGEYHRDRLAEALDVMERVDEADLVAAPDLFRPVVQAGQPLPAWLGEEEGLALQKLLLDHCARRGDRFAILSALPPAVPPEEDLPDRVNGYAAKLSDRYAGSVNAALYYPWLKVDGLGACPPCGHVAGVYSATDAAVGFHKAPANVALEGVVDLAVDREITDTEHRFLAPEVNVIRAFPGRGIRVWGARTLGGRDQADWRYVPVRRVMLTIARWLEQFMMRVSFEVNDATLWSRITREVGAYLGDLHRRGVLTGPTPQDAFYVRCDSTTNPPETLDQGRVVTEIGIASGVPNEFIAVRVTHTAGGVTITGPNPA